MFRDLNKEILNFRWLESFCEFVVLFKILLIYSDFSWYIKLYRFFRFLEFVLFIVLVGFGNFSCCVK